PEACQGEERIERHEQRIAQFKVARDRRYDDGADDMRGEERPRNRAGERADYQEQRHQEYRKEEPTAHSLMAALRSSILIVIPCVRLRAPSTVELEHGVNEAHRWYFGTSEERADPMWTTNCEHILKARALVFHYALFAHQLDAAETGNTQGHVRGIGEL